MPVPANNTTCRTCGVPFHAFPSEVALGRGRYCSLRCRDQGMKREPNCICATCGTLFHKHPSDIRKGRGRYCSRPCYDVGQTTRITKVCAHCGKTFSIIASQVTDENQCCSRECFLTRTQKVACQCEICGATYLAYRNEVFTRHCCSNACKHERLSYVLRGENHPLWRGGIRTTRRAVTREYKAWRIAVFRRDNFTCLKCGARGKKLNAHHVRHWNTHPECRFDVANGQTLCVLCHRAEHSRKSG